MIQSKEEQNAIIRGQKLWWKIESMLPALKMDNCEEYSNKFRLHVLMLPKEVRADLKAWVEFQTSHLEKVFTAEIKTILKKVYTKYKLQQEVLQKI